MLQRYLDQTGCRSLHCSYEVIYPLEIIPFLRNCIRRLKICIRLSSSLSTGISPAFRRVTGADPSSLLRSAQGVLLGYIYHLQVLSRAVHPLSSWSPPPSGTCPHPPCPLPNVVVVSPWFAYDFISWKSGCFPIPFSCDSIALIDFPDTILQPSETLVAIA